jgi:hypothetical protein
MSAKILFFTQSFLIIEFSGEAAAKVLSINTKCTNIGISEGLNKKSILKFCCIKRQSDYMIQTIVYKRINRREKYNRICNFLFSLFNYSTLFGTRIVMSNKLYPTKSCPIRYYCTAVSAVSKRIITMPVVSVDLINYRLIKS